MRRYLSVLILACILTAVRAEKLKYAGQYLQKAVAALQLDMAVLDTLVEADTMFIVSKMPIHIRIRDGRLDHLGWYLFNPEVRRLSPSPVYDYLEYGCLDNRLHLTEDPFVYQKVVFQQGSWEKMTQLTEDVPCSITLLENQVYQVVWRDDSHAVDVFFPVGYERLYMVTRRELEKRFLDDMESYKVTSQAETEKPDEKKLVVLEDSIYYLPGESYQLPMVNRNLYYQKHPELGWVLIWDARRPAESLANLFVSNDKWLNSIPVELTFITYDREKRIVRVPIGNLLSLAAESGCKAYFGLESLEADKMNVALFLYSPSYGFDHVFHLSCNPQLMDKEEFLLTGRGALYAPTTNVSDLFSNRTGKSSPKKIER